MLVGVIADTHDNLPLVARAMELFRRRGVGAVLHAGDFVAPFALKALLEPGIPLYGVFGNNDGERAGLGSLCPTLHEAPYRVELGGRTIVLAHSPQQLDARSTEGADLVIHGHTHRVRLEAGRPLLLNPGEAGGWLTGRPTVAVVDLEAMKAEIVELRREEAPRP